MSARKEEIKTNENIDVNKPTFYNKTMYNLKKKTYCNNCFIEKFNIL